jgi:hypothetical protein
LLEGFAGAVRRLGNRVLESQRSDNSRGLASDRRVALIEIGIDIEIEIGQMRKNLDVDPDPDPDPDSDPDFDPGMNDAAPQQLEAFARSLRAQA